MKNLFIVVLCLFAYGTANAQIGEVKKSSSTSYAIYDERGNSLGSASTWSSCELMGYTSKFIVFQCSDYSIYVKDHKGNSYASKQPNSLYGKATITSVTPSGITLKKENGEKRQVDFKLSPK